MDHSQSSQKATQPDPAVPATNGWNRIRGFPQRAARSGRKMASNSPSPPETPRLAPASPASSEGAGSTRILGFPPSPTRGPIFVPQYPPLPPRHVSRHVPYADRCYSLGMSRVYDDTLRCDKCGRASDFGWFYRCTNEAEARLYDSIREGNIEYFDETGKVFSQQLNKPARGPAARADKLSLLQELAPEQVESLSGPQLAKLLKQRENANSTALTDKYGFLAPAVDDRPYLTSERQECKSTLCPHCGKGMVGEEMAFLSLDGILKGDIPPTVAVGHSFRRHGRPVADAGIVRNIGLRLDQEAKAEVSKPARHESMEITESLGPQDKEDETTLNASQPLSPSGTFNTTSDSNEDLLELYTDEDSVEIAREDDLEAFL
ncbi:hypothetical protein VSDG_08159 [Cytospora chrysosperma]|uniref:Uncharacterized protein n=1 Tax=Cytospora chrysosperma TaxID=252740 RepID=A0A423VH21_CYTCH|nr:hypothetical protein VSDG_08159 [Valsa sordida]